MCAFLPTLPFFGFSHPTRPCLCSFKRPRLTFYIPRAQAAYVPDDDDKAEPASDIPTELTLAQQLLMKQYVEQVDRMSTEECRKLAIEVVRQMMMKDNIMKKITKKEVNFGIEPPDPYDFMTEESDS